MKKKFWLTLTALTLTLIALGFLRVSPFKEKEQDVIASLQAKQPATAVSFLQYVSDYGKVINIGIPSIFFLVGLARRKRTLIRNGLLVLLAMIFSGLMARAIKVTVKEPRPYEVDSRIAQLSDGGSNSFPSGHSVEVSVAMMGIALMLYRTPTSIVLSVAWALLMMYSRIVLGVHNFTDIVGGFVLGCIALVIMHSVFERFVPVTSEIKNR